MGRTMEASLVLPSLWGASSTDYVFHHQFVQWLRANNLSLMNRMMMTTSLAPKMRLKAYQKKRTVE